MSVRLEGNTIYLEGDCFIEDAEPLATLLHAPGRIVDLGQCRRVHTALLQALLVFRPYLTGAMEDDALFTLLADHLPQAKQ